MTDNEPFVLRIQNLEQGANPLERVGAAPDLGLGPDEVHLAGRVVLRATAWRAGEKVEIQGTVTAEYDLACDRCLEPVRLPVALPLRVYAERQPARDRRSAQELREEDLGIVYHDGQSVSLTDEIRQVLLVEVPWHVLCREDCAGLCPRCGADRNRGPCACAEPGAGPD